MVAVLTVACVSFAPPTAHAATTRWVDDGAVAPFLGTEASPYKTITAAMAAAVSGDTIKVKPGTYNTALGESFPIAIKPGITLESTGGFQETKLVGNGVSSVVTITDATANTVLKGFQVSGGGPVDGSGVLVTQSFMVTSYEGWPRISNNEIWNNDAGASDGGGMYIAGALGASAKPYLYQTHFSSNEAFRGGGVALGSWALPEFEECNFFGNTAENGGGGLCVLADYSLPELKNNSFYFNNVTNGGGGGAKLGNGIGGTAILTGNRFYENTALFNGGGVWSAGLMSISCQGNEFIRNKASVGGGLYFTGAPLPVSADLSNNLFAENEAVATGGAIYSAGAVMIQVNDTVYANTSSGWPGVYYDTWSGGSWTMKNCIVTGHVSDKDVKNATISYSLVDDTTLAADGNTVGAGIIHGDPLFYPPDGWGGSDYRLQVGSPAIDAGTASGAPATDYQGTSRPQDGDGDGTAKVDLGYWERPDLAMVRQAGNTRYATAVEIALSAFDSAEVAVIASGENFPDALSASGLCGAYDAPLLLTQRDVVPPAMLAALDELGVEEVVIVGGESVVAKAVADKLDAEGYSVERIWGSNRYVTSAAVARKIVDVRGAYLGGESVFVARGDEFPDALALSPLSFYSTAPIVLVEPGSLPLATAAVLEEIDAARGFVGGGTGAVSEAVKSAIDKILIANGGTATERWAGSNRYTTAREIAESGFVAWDYVGIATGTNFPDALAGGVAAGRMQGPVLLTEPTKLSSPTAASLAEHGPVVSWVEIYGGTAAVSDAVETQIRAALGW